MSELHKAKIRLQRNLKLSQELGYLTEDELDRVAEWCLKAMIDYSIVALVDSGEIWITGWSEDEQCPLLSRVNSVIGPITLN